MGKKFGSLSHKISKIAKSILEKYQDTILKTKKGSKNRPVTTTYRYVDTFALDFRKEFDFTVRYSVAEAAAIYRRSHGRVVKFRLCGRTAYATSDAQILQHIMGAEKWSKYLLRPGEVFGLRMIGMLNQGIIWNQDLIKFKENRPFFEGCLTSNALSRGFKLALDVGQRWCETFTDEWKEA